jgi:hypothetical protein
MYAASNSIHHWPPESEEIETYTKAVEQATLAKTAMASVTKAFHKAEVANPMTGYEIDFNALILKDQNMQVALPRGLEPPSQSA